MTDRARSLADMPRMGLAGWRGHLTALGVVAAAILMTSKQGVMVRKNA